MWIKVEKILDVLLFAAYIMVFIFDLVEGRADAAVAWVCCMAWNAKSNVETMRRRSGEKTETKSGGECP